MKNESIAISYCINIPKDVTNGDVIKAMFPYLTVKKTKNGFIGVYLSGNSYYHYYNLDWWNAKYKGVSE